MKKVLKFYSKTCAPCKVMGRALADLKDVEIKEVDIAEEENASLLKKWNIRAVPTVVVLDEDSNLLGEFRGITPIEKIKEVL